MPVRTTPHTPMQLAAAGLSLERGAALLKLRNGCNLRTARAAMRQALELLRAPMGDRLEAGLKEEAHRQVGLHYGRIPVGQGCHREADSSFVRWTPPVFDAAGNMVEEGQGVWTQTTHVATADRDVLIAGSL